MGERASSNVGSTRGSHCLALVNIIRNGYLIECYWHLNTFDVSTQLVYKGVKTRERQRRHKQDTKHQTTTETLVCANGDN